MIGLPLQTAVVFDCRFCAPESEDAAAACGSGREIERLPTKRAGISDRPDLQISVSRGGYLAAIPQLCNTERQCPGGGLLQKPRGSQGGCAVGSRSPASTGRPAQRLQEWAVGRLRPQRGQVSTTGAAIQPFRWQTG